MRIHRTLGLALLLACGNATGPDPDAWHRLSSGQLVLFFQPADSARAGQLLSFAQRGVTLVSSELTPISAPVTIRVFRDRTSLDLEWRQMMGAPGFQFECWMIAGASATTVLMLSPRAYSCNPSDDAYVLNVVAHELVHVVHHRAASGNIAPAWFYEGLAGYISGQYDNAARRQAAEALRTNPNLRLNALMTSPVAYQLSASLVAHIDALRGRAFLRELMQETSLQGIMGRIGLTEDALLAGWRNGLTN